MFTLIVTEKGGSPKRMDFDKDEITIGRVPGNDVILPKGNVSKRHTRVVRQDGRFFVVDLKSTNGTYLNGRRITTPSVIRPGDKIYVGDFVVMVEASDGASAAVEDIDGDEGTTNMRADEAQARIREAAIAAQQQQAQIESRPEVSQVEPLPLDEEPPESAPPPPRPMAPSAPQIAGPPPLGGMGGPMPSPRAPLATPGAASPLGPPAMASRPMMTQPLGSASTAAMAAMAPPPGASPGPNRPTQPPPPRANPLRAPSVPGLGRAPLPGARPPGGMGGPPPASSAAAPSVQRPSAPPAPMAPPETRRPSATAIPAAQTPPSVQSGSPSPTLDAEPEADSAPPAPVFSPPSASDTSAAFAPPPSPSSPAFPAPAPSSGFGPPPSASSTHADSEPPPAVQAAPPPTPPAPPAPPVVAAPVAAPPAPPPVVAAPPPAPPAPAAPPPSAAPAPVAQAATLNISPSVVDAVIQAHKAASVTTATGEPTPIGREYATLLGEVVTEASANAPNVGGDKLADASTRSKIRSAVETAARERSNLPNGVTPERLIRDATAEIAGTGAFETALEETDVTTIVVEAHGRVYIGRGDTIGPSPFWFSSTAALTRAIDRLLRTAGVSRGDDAVVEASLPDGSRLVAAFPPNSPSGPTAVVERAAKTSSLVDLAARQVITSQAVSAIASALVTRRNIVVSGPRGSGRTTILGALIASASATDRCLLVERSRELAPTLENVTALVAGDQWDKAIHLALRLRPQRLALGDTSEAGAITFVNGLSTGNEGMFFVADGPSPALALQRVATLAAAGGQLTRDEALARIAQTRPLVIHVARLGDGTCRVVSIGDARAEGNGVRVDDQFSLRIEGVNSSGKIEASLVPTPARSSLS